MTKPTKTYVRAYDVGRVVAWLQERNVTLPQIASTCDLKVSYLAFTLRKYRTNDKTSRTDETKAKRLYVMMERPIERCGRAYATDAEMQEFRKCVSTLTDAGMTYTHISKETGLDRSTIMRGMSHTLTRASVAKLLSVRSDLAFDAQNGFGRTRSHNRYTTKDRVESYRRHVQARHETDAIAIREWVADNPNGSRTRCARELGWSPQRVINVDNEARIFAESAKRKRVDDELFARYVELRRADPRRSAKSVAAELGIGQRAMTKMNKMMKEMEATHGDTDL